MMKIPRIAGPINAAIDPGGTVASTGTVRGFKNKEA
jgi:hypothetical protein